MFTKTTYGTSASCKDVQFVFARGSGSELKKDEYVRFRDKIVQRIDTSKVSINTYELGSDDAQPFSYPAVKVDGGNLLVGLGAQVSNGDSFSYGESVKSGVNELHIYLLKKVVDCPDIKIILGGYSQGAQVMGQALADMPARVKDNIIFVALFGDPKLYLPEGEGIWPPACRDEGFSDWRRTVPDCGTDNGKLGARNPYVPTYYKSKVGLWCNDNDWICGSSKNAMNNSGHTKYADIGGSIDESIIEILKKLKTKLPADKAKAIDDKPLSTNNDGGEKLNVSYILSANASSQQAYDFSKESVIAQAETVWSVNGRVAITVYREESGGGGTIIHPLAGYGLHNTPQTRGLLISEDRNNFFGIINEIPEFAPLSANTRMTVYLSALFSTEELPWQRGASKAIVFVAEKPLYYKYGFRYLQSQSRWVPYEDFFIRRSLEIDPVSAYFVVGSDVGIEAAESVAKATGGKVKRYNPEDLGSLAKSLAEVQGDIIDRPEVVFGNSVYHTKPNVVLSFDVSRSRANSGQITKYDWDYDGDGEWDKTTSEPYSSHKYPEGFKGLIHVLATDSNQRSGSMTAEITSENIETPILLPVASGVKYELLSTENDMSKVRLTWDPVNPSVPFMALSVNGVHLGRIDSNRTTIDIEGVSRTGDSSIDLQAMDDDYRLGERSGVVVPAIAELKEQEAEEKQQLIKEIVGQQDPGKSEVTPIGQLSNFQPSQSVPAPQVNPAGSVAGAQDERPSNHTSDNQDYNLVPAVASASVIAAAWILYKRTRGKG